MPSRLASFFLLTYFAQGMGGIVFEPLSYWLKDGYGMGPGAAASFTAWMTLPFLLKPLFGLAADFFPIGGRRRKPHALLSAGLWAACWILLAARRPGGAAALLALLILANCGTVMTDVVCDGLMVERGKSAGRTGTFQALQIGSLYCGLVVSGLGGGWLSARATPAQVFALGAVFPALAVAAALLIDEEPRAVRSREAAANLWRFLRSGEFWRIAAVIFLWSFNPSLGTAQFYFQSETLKLDPVTIGALATLGGGAGMLGAALFAKAAAADARVLLSPRTAAAAWAAASLTALFYSGPGSAAVLTVFLGCAGTFFRLSLMDLAARSCPALGEATAFAALMSVFNLAAWGSNTAGGWGYEWLRAFPMVGARGAWTVLVLIGAASTLAAWALSAEGQGMIRRAPK